MDPHAAGSYDLLDSAEDNTTFDSARRDSSASRLTNLTNSLLNGSTASKLGNGEGGKQPESDSKHASNERSLTRDGGRSGLPPRFSSLPYATSQTGLVYDVRMRFHSEPIPEENDLHPEDPRRIHAIFEAFVAAGLAFRYDVSGPSADYYMGRIDAREVTKQEACLVHTPAHWDWVQHLKDLTPDELQDIADTMDSIYLSSSTPFSAALSAGGAIEACRAILLGKVKNVFAVIRPPGHHAEREDAKGFCIFDNVSIATKVCQREFGEKCRKVFILDWDVHHGNGVQQAHYSDPNVLYISLHVHERGNFYPEQSYKDQRQGYGNHLHCGAGAGLGKNVNIPWTRKGMGDADYIYAFQQIVMPIATEFNPDLVIIAAGFDAALGDLLGGCKVTPAGYAHMTHMLMSLAGGKLAVCLEGGYNLDSIAKSATAVARTLMGEPPDRLENMTPTESAVDDIKLVLRQQSRFWQCLYPKDPSGKLAGQLQGERMHNVIRKYQAETLVDQHGMIPLYIHRTALVKEFENQVMATQYYTEKRPLVVVVHDPPEILASPDPRTGRIDLHNAWLTDVMKNYVDWAVEQGFIVFDVNLPQHISDTDDDDDDQPHKDSDSPDSRITEATMIMSYLWDNYIEPNEPTHVILVGTNAGYCGIVNFIKANELRAMASITRIISFVQNAPLMRCSSRLHEELAGWYRDASMIYLSGDHQFWQTDLAQKPRRYGNPRRSDYESISAMLAAHQDEVIKVIMNDTADWHADYEGNDKDSQDLDMGVAKSLAGTERLPTSLTLSPKPKIPASNIGALQNAFSASSPPPLEGTPLPVQRFASPMEQ